MKVRIGILGYGNLGKGVEKAVLANSDEELVGVFTRRDPSTVKTASDVKVFSADELPDLRDKLDVLVLCGGSATDLPKMTPEYAEMFNVVDSFDTHAKIPEHFKNVDSACKRGQKTAVISAGWDPGLFSLARLYSKCILPAGNDYTFWGRGVSQGHSDAIRRIEGVVDARQYTVPVPEALEKVRNGENPTLTTRQKHTRECFVVVEEGADKMMEAVNSLPVVEDVKGEPGTNAGGMLEKVRQVMSNLTNQHPKDIMIQDLLAVDTYTPQKVKGGLANEYTLESAVGIAAMVKADRLQMEMIAEELTDRLKIPVYVGGVEADMAIKGALTTPGTNVPLAIVDMGAGSTDASIINKDGEVKLVHLAGAGNMVTLLIQSELGLEDFNLAEDIKKYPLAKVESFFHIRHEDGTVQFFEEPLDPATFAKVVLVKPEGLIPLEGLDSMEKIKMIRTNAKKKVFVTNAIRSLVKVSPTGNVRDIAFVVLVGGSALDFEVPTLVTDALSQYNIVAGRGNIRGCEGPRNAVATGLAMSCADV